MTFCRHAGLAALLAAAAVLPVGCDSEEPTASAPAEQAESPGNPFCTEKQFEGSRFTVCRLDARRDDVRLAWRGRDGQGLRSFAALEQDLGKDRNRVRFAMNAGMFDENGAPIGLYVEKGERLKRINLNPGPGNFHMKPNGVFAVDGRGRVAVTRSDRVRKASRPEWATQSGPMLVVNGRLHPKFAADGPSQLIRNGVGILDPATAFFAISEDPVSFGRFARLFRDGLGCTQALFLDGSVSSLWDPGAGRMDSHAELGPMIVVMARPPAAKRKPAR